MFDALYTNGLFSVKIQRFIDAIVQDYTLYTSLESCPMCLVRLITSSVHKILHAAPDIEGGMVHESKNLPQFWSDLGEGKIFSQALCSQEMINAASEIFRLNLEEFIEKIKNIHRVLPRFLRTYTLRN